MACRNPIQAVRGTETARNLVQPLANTLGRNPIQAVRGTETTTAAIPIAACHHVEIPFKPFAALKLAVFALDLSNGVQSSRNPIQAVRGTETPP